MTRDDILTAKDELDNFDQLTGAVATLAQQKGGTFTVTLPPSLKLRFPVADLLAFLTEQRAKIVDNLLKTYNISLT